MLKKISVAIYFGVFLFLPTMVELGLCQGQVNNKTRETGVVSQPVSATAEFQSAVTPPPTPTAITVSAIVKTSIAKAKSSSEPTSATAAFNQIVTLDPSKLNSMTIYVLNTPIVNQGLATINISGTTQPIYINSEVQTITSEDSGFSSWFDGTYSSITVYNHDTGNEWNPQTFYITWQ